MRAFLVFFAAGAETNVSAAHLAVAFPRQLYREMAFSEDGTMVTSGGALGREHACELNGKKFIYCWGDNAMGQLGYEDTRPRMRLEAEAIDLGCEALGARSSEGGCAVGLAVGSWHTCVLLTEGSVKCWGQNNAGQLGYGDTISRGNDAGEMGDQLPSIALDGRVKTMSLGERHSCVKFRNGNDYCWGRCPMSEAESMGATEMPTEGCESYHKMPTVLATSAAAAALLFFVL